VGETARSSLRFSFVFAVITSRGFHLISVAEHSGFSNLMRLASGETIKREDFLLLKNCQGKC
jgi:hypothetical protein